jgi:hypothetical protein
MITTLNFQRQVLVDFCFRRHYLTKSYDKKDWKSEHCRLMLFDELGLLGRLNYGAPVNFPWAKRNSDYFCYLIAFDWFNEAQD